MVIERFNFDLISICSILFHILSLQFTYRLVSVGFVLISFLFILSSFCFVGFHLYFVSVFSFRQVSFRFGRFRFGRFRFISFRFAFILSHFTGTLQLTLPVIEVIKKRGTTFCKVLCFRFSMGQAVRSIAQELSIDCQLHTS